MLTDRSTDGKGKGFFSPFTFRLSPRLAFTLAEVLIVIGILGIVAEMTIPTLYNDYLMSRYYSMFMKGYTDLSQVIESLVLENGDMASAISSYGTLTDAISSKVNVTLFCPAGTMEERCMPYNSTAIDGTSLPEGYFAGNRLSLLNGEAIYINDFDNTCNGSDNSITKVCASIMIDTNGVTEPNRLGRDLFYFDVTSNKLVAIGNQGTNQAWTPTWTWYCNPKITDPNSGIACAGRLLQQGKMDY